MSHMYVCCNLMQSVAVCYSVLQCVTVCYSAAFAVEQRNL